MNNFLSKEHCCYKIHASSTKSSAYSFYMQIPLYGLPLPFLQDSLDPLFMTSQKFHPYYK